ncbi:MAG: hypothetical protein ACTSVZ_03905 [Promethearchaeota archaeon]
MGKDKAFGFTILLLGVLMIIFYIFWGPLSLIYDLTGNLSGLSDLFGVLQWQWALMIPIFLGVVLFGLLAAWIGYSMITTPPPVPLEELEEELEAEEAAAKEAAKTD